MTLLLGAECFKQGVRNVSFWKKICCADVLQLYSPPPEKKLKNVEQLYLKICYTEFNENWTINMDIADRNYFLWRNSPPPPPVGQDLIIGAS